MRVSTISHAGRPACVAGSSRTVRDPRATVESPIQAIMVGTQSYDAAITGLMRVSRNTPPVTMKRTEESTLTRLSPVWIACSTMTITGTRTAAGAAPRGPQPLDVPADDVRISPDGRHALIVHANQLYVAALLNPYVGDVELNLKSPVLPLVRLTDVGADYFGWGPLDEIVWSTGDRVYRRSLASVDFAVQRKLEYIEYDAHWYGDGTDPSDATVPIPGLDIERVIQYARQRNVGVIVYVDRVPAMRQLDDILRTYARWGIAGIKFGFIWEGRQSDADWLFEVLRKCGEHRMLVNLHDNLRPAGLERTLPNYIALEGVRGNEQFPTARHNVTLPFTRNLVGPIDYTICYAHEKNQTTNAHQLAMAVVYYNPLTFLYWYDKPAKYAQGEWPELSFFDECPTTWDETRVLAGEIGEYIVIARRHGQRWFLGAMTNELPRQLDVSLNFLATGTWEAHMYADGSPARVPNQTPVQVGRKTVGGSRHLRLDLAPSGGQAIRFEPR